MVATLIRRYGDWDLAEEATADAFAEAARRWPTEGTPRRPGAWLTTVAAHRAVDRLRRGRRGAELLEQVGRDHERVAIDPDPGEAEAVPDDRLALIFTCCHPALALEARVALTLRMLGGLSTAETARAFLVEEATMAKRITRAKAKIAAAQIPYRVPEAEELAERLSGVLAVLYLMFNEGYLAAGGASLLRVDLCQEAIRLTRILVALLDGAAVPSTGDDAAPAAGVAPGAPASDVSEAHGLLALMLLHHARRAARTDAAGDLVRLEEQDRAKWDPELLDAGRGELERALAAGTAGPYTLQAAIAAAHVLGLASDWPRIAELYAALAQVMDTPVVALNRAVAVAQAGDLSGALALLDRLEADGALAGYHLLSATQAEMLRRAGRLDEARSRFRRAAAEAPEGPERRFLERQLEQLDAERGRRADHAGP